MRQVTYVSLYTLTLPLYVAHHVPRGFCRSHNIFCHLPKLFNDLNVGTHCVSFGLRTLKTGHRIGCGKRKLQGAILQFGPFWIFWEATCYHVEKVGSSLIVISKDTFRRSPLLGAIPTRAASLAPLRRSQPSFMAWYMARRVGAMVSRTDETALVHWGVPPKKT